MTILGIETSCDETAAAVVRDGLKGRGPQLASSVVASQMAVHRPFGGVVPELASRSHIRFVTEVMEQALAKARVSPKRVDAVAATAGPGLPGSLLVGLTAAKAFAWLLRKPFLAVNHIEAHVYAAFLEARDLAPPLLALVVSGGHTELIAMRAHGAFRILGRTRDDAAGEAYDKVGKLLGLGYPGGPRVERLARGARRHRSFPVARLKTGGLDFSFSGLKTAVANAVPRAGGRADLALRRRSGRSDLQALAAGFQEAVIAALEGRAREALAATHARTLVLAGGVAANGAVRDRLAALARAAGVRFVVPAVRLCTDNAAMIACAGWYRARRGEWSPLTAPARAGWKAGEPLGMAA